MKENSDKIYDQAEIDLLRKKTSEEISRGASGWQISAIQYLLSAIEEVVDENESLWFMLDEEKNSKANSDHTKMLNDLIQNRITYLKMVQGNRGEA